MVRKKMIWSKWSMQCIKKWVCHLEMDHEDEDDEEEKK